MKLIRIIIFVHCPWTIKIEEAIQYAKDLNKKVFFDTDDLLIDKIYIDMIPYVQTLSPKERENFDEKAILLGKTLKLCDGAITITESLSKELKNYVSNVFINHNVASEEIWKLSQNALLNKSMKKKRESIIIGYISENIHDNNLEMIKNALIKILEEFKNTNLLLIGDFTVPNFLNNYSNRVEKKVLNDYKELPNIFSNLDINLVPMEKNIYNKVKGENKWFEAALMKVPTIASNYGVFKKIIKQNITGLLSSDIKDWYRSLKYLIENENVRKNIGKNAYNVCQRKYNTIYTSLGITNFINSITNRHIGFYIPSLHSTGGFYVIMNHACILKDEGWDVELILPETSLNLFEYQGHKFNIINLKNSMITVEYDIIVATFFTTVSSILNYYKTKRRLYLVQNYETNFYPYGDYFRGIAERTYFTPFGIEYITISKWCEKWLWKKYRKKSLYAPNGIDFDNFTSRKRNLKKKKLRILIEGDSSSHYKNVDESFKIIEKLDKNNFEVWYLSYRGKPKDWYLVDKFFYEIPHDKVSQIYYKCDILLKSSWLESFSYPPLEMMATGGYCIVVPNEGNKEYLKDNENCLFYELGDIDGAIECINRLISDEELQQHLYENGLETARGRDWKNYKDQIISLYNN